MGGRSMRAFLISVVTLMASLSIAEYDAVPFFRFTQISNSASLGEVISSPNPINGELVAVSIVGCSNSTPIRITGATDPVGPNGYYRAGGTYSGSLYYAKTDGDWYIWNSGRGTTYVSAVVGTLGTINWAWTNTGGEVFTATNYTPAAATGVVTVASTSVDVDLDITASGVNMPTRTLFSIDDLTTNAVYYPRVAMQNINGTTNAEYMKIPLHRDIISATAYDAGMSNSDVKVFIIYDKK